MRHQKAFRKLGRTSSHRRAMMRNMVTSLLLHEQIQTTDAKAKELRRVADRMISLAKDGSLHARRQALAFIKSKSVVAKLFDELKQRYESRAGGYTRIVKVGYRRGDCAPISVISLVTEDIKKPSRSRRARKKAKAAQAEAQATPQAAKPEAVAAEKKTEPEKTAAGEQAPEAEAVEAEPKKEAELKADKPTEPEDAAVVEQAPEAEPGKDAEVKDEEKKEV